MIDLTEDLDILKAAVFRAKLNEEECILISPKFMDYLQDAIMSGDGADLDYNLEGRKPKGRTLCYLRCRFFDNIEDLKHYESNQN